MALARTMAAALVGVRAHLVEVEADLSAGLPGLSFTGLADTSVVESRDRIRAAVLNSGAEWPNRRITMALLPADLRKVGARFDLALAVAVLAAAGQVRANDVARVLFIAELGLDGRLRPVRGVLPAVLAARSWDLDRVVVSRENAAEAALVAGMDIRVAGQLGEIVAALQGTGEPLERAQPMAAADAAPVELDLRDVVGQTAAKRAVEVAAAGAHHLALIGAPGAGKTMLAQRLPDVLPALNADESLEVTAVHSVAGALRDDSTLITRPPWQAPHHSCSVAALVGGGAHLARPGAISLAHRGVLFLDEAPEFAPTALDALRQPLESGEVVLHRGGGAVSYPARFQLVLAANPCPCGQTTTCECLPAVRVRYLRRLSGPLRDRVDITVRVAPVSRAALLAETPGESTADVAARVAQARAAAAARWQESPWSTNAAVPGPVLRSPPWSPPYRVLAPAETYLDRGVLSARGLDRVLRVAWTLADLAGRDSPDRADISEALFFRTGEAA